MPSFGFPGVNTRKIRVVADPPNWLDRATIVSIYPIDLDEKKHTIQPSRFIVPAGSRATPTVVIVGRSTWWKSVDEDQEFEVVNSSIQVAESVVKDYCIGLHEAAYNDGIGPGLLWIPGCKYDKFNKVNFEATYKWVLEDNADKLDAAVESQKKWFLRLVETADSLWARSNSNPLAISDIMKLAARELGITDKEWQKNQKESEKQTCAACGFRAAKEAVICMNCRFVLNAAKYEEIKHQFASPVSGGGFNPASIK